MVLLVWDQKHRVPDKKDPKRPTPRHIIIKILKVGDKERIFKAAREKQLVTCKGTFTRFLMGLNEKGGGIKRYKLGVSE